MPVEFVPEDDARDEPAPVPPETLGHRFRRRTWWPVAAAVALVLVAVGWALTRPSGSPSAERSAAARTTVTVGPTSYGSTGASSQRPPGAVRPQPGPFAARHCFYTMPCLTVRHVPAAVRAAIAARLSPLRQLSVASHFAASSINGPGFLSAREIRAADGRFRIAVAVRRRIGIDAVRISPVLRARTTVIIIHRRLPHYSVDISFVTRTPPTRRDLRRIDAIAHDPRLEAG